MARGTLDGLSVASSSLWRSRNPRVLIAAASIFYLFLGACTEANPPPLPAARVPADRSIQEDDIREAVFRYRIKKRYPEFSQTPSFLSIDGEDPSDEFMACFAGSKPPVKKGSGGYIKEDPLAEFRGDPNKRPPLEGRLRDRSNDRQAFALHVGEIGWNSPRRVEVKGGTYCGWLCGDGGVFRVVKKNDVWMVENYEQRVIF